LKWEGEKDSKINDLKFNAELIIEEKEIILDLF
jgi:hypothetical protein